jgi:phosphatidylinositol alpha 1,6-mannosyltransferase
VLRGEALADAYADMDLLVFPSHTDTFGNVVLEALASGVPALVTPDGGPAHIVRNGVTGRVAQDAGFADAVMEMVGDGDALESMRRCARVYALQCSWDAVFERVVKAYPVRRGIELPAQDSV